MREVDAERIDGGIDAEFRERTREHGGGVEVSEGRGRSGIGQIVGGHVDGLHGSDGALVGGGDALLQFAHFGCEVRLVSHGRRHAAEQRGNLGPGLGEAEDVVDEEQRVGSLFVAEIFGDGESGERDAQTRTWRLGHLAVDKSSLGLLRNP